MELARRPSWLVGIGLSAVAFGLHSAALALGSFALMQPIVVSATVFAVLVARFGRRGCVTMSMHKLPPGYDYLTWQVAALDSTEKGHTGLAAYYAERGEKPGDRFGMAVIDGLSAATR